jgi:hypothetical protein
MSESTSARSAPSPHAVDEAPVADEDSATAQPSVVLGVVVAPGLARNVTAEIVAQLADDLVALDTGVDWRTELRVDGLVVPPAQTTEIIEAARQKLLDENWDLAPIIVMGRLMITCAGVATMLVIAGAGKPSGMSLSGKRYPGDRCPSRVLQTVASMGRVSTRAEELIPLAFSRELTRAQRKGFVVTEVVWLAPGGAPTSSRTRALRRLATRSCAAITAQASWRLRSRSRTSRCRPRHKRPSWSRRREGGVCTGRLHSWGLAEYKPVSLSQSPLI